MINNSMQSIARKYVTIHSFIIAFNFSQTRIYLFNIIVILSNFSFRILFKITFLIEYLIKST